MVLFFKVYSTNSDVWAYGVVLYEIATLAKTPYPGKHCVSRVRLFEDIWYMGLSGGE